MNNKKFLKDLGKKIKQIRTKKRLSQQELGKMLDLSEITIYRYENGITSPFNKIKEIASALNCEVGIILEDTKEFTNFPSPNATFAQIPLIKFIKKNLPSSILSTPYTYPCPEWIYRKYKKDIFALQIKNVTSKIVKISKGDVGIFSFSNVNNLKLTRFKRKWEIIKSNYGIASLLRIEKNFIK